LQITLLAVISLAIISSWLAGAETQAVLDVKSLYEKREVMIPMRDGVKLLTAVYSPRDTSQRYPILLTRTAYGIPPYGSDTYRTVIGPSEHFTREGYIVVYQDVRGRFKSEGEFIHHVPYVKGSPESVAPDRPARSSAAVAVGAHRRSVLTGRCPSLVRDESYSLL
jgi:uncharacterized protein